LAWICVAISVEAVEAIVIPNLLINKIKNFEIKFYQTTSVIWPSFTLITTLKTGIMNLSEVSFAGFGLL
jgi:hypothetical protein